MGGGRKEQTILRIYPFLGIAFLLRERMFNGWSTRERGGGNIMREMGSVKLGTSV